MWKPFCATGASSAPASRVYPEKTCRNVQVYLEQSKRDQRASILAAQGGSHTCGFGSLLAYVLVTMTLRERLPGRGTCSPENCPASEGLLARATRGTFAAGNFSKERHVTRWTPAGQAAGRKQDVGLILNPTSTINRSLPKPESCLFGACTGLRCLQTSKHVLSSPCEPAALLALNLPSKIRTLSATLFAGI